MSNATYNPNLPMTYGIDPQYRRMQTVVHNAPTAYQVAVAYHAGVQVNPQPIYYTQNLPNTLPLQPTQNYINYARNHAQVGTHAQNHAQNPIQKRVKLSHTQESPTAICKRSPAQIILQKRARKQSQQRTQRLTHTQIRAKGPAQIHGQVPAQIQAQNLAEIHAQSPKIHAQTPVKIDAQTPNQMPNQTHAQRPVKDDAQKSTRRAEAVRVDQNLQVPARWRTDLERLINDVVSDQEVGYSPEFHKKVMAASNFCLALYASSSSAN